MELAWGGIYASYRFREQGLSVIGLERASGFGGVCPIGTRRLCFDTGYHETFNRANVTLVDMRETPIVEITETGVRTPGDHYEVELLIFALGFKPFLGASTRRASAMSEDRRRTTSGLAVRALSSG